MASQNSKNRQNPNGADDEDFDIFDLPSLSPSFFENDKVNKPRPKVAVTLQMDPDILTWFRSQGTGWDLKMVAVLRRYVESKSEN